MKNDDLMDALSGLDPKYIDEAAFELHGKPQAKQKDKLFTLKRSLYIAIPAAAVIFLTLLLYPAVRSINSDKSAASEAAEAPTEAAESAMQEAAEAPADAADELPTDAMYDATAAPAAENESLTVPQNAEKSALERSNAALINKAVYDKGILTVTLSAPLTADPADITYSISGKEPDGSYKTYAAGKLKDIITSKDPLTLDISSLELEKGTYYLTFDSEKAEFTIP